MIDTTQMAAISGFAPLSPLQTPGQAQAPQAEPAPSISSGSGVSMNFSSRAASPLQDTISSLSDFSASQSSLANGMSFASQLSDMFAGARAGLLMQGGPGQGSAGLMENFGKLLQSVMENFTVESIEMANVNGTMVVVFDIAEIPNDGDGGSPMSLDDFASRLDSLDQTTQDGFDQTLDMLQNGQKAMGEMMGKITEMMEMLEKQSKLIEKLIEELAKSSGQQMPNITNLSEDVARMLASDVAQGLFSEPPQDRQDPDQNDDWARGPNATSQGGSTSTRTAGSATSGGTSGGSDAGSTSTA